MPILRIFASILLSTGVATTHFYFATTGVLELGLIALSLLLLLFAQHPPLENYSPQSSRFKYNFLLICFIVSYALNFMYLSSSVFTGDGITQQALDHFTINSLVEGSTGWVRFHYGLVLIAAIFAIAWNRERLLFNSTKLLFKSQRASEAASIQNKSHYLISFVLGVTALAIHPASADLGRHLVINKNSSGIDMVLRKQLSDGFVSDRQIRKYLSTTDENQPHKDILVIYLESFEKAIIDAELYPGLANKLRNFVDRGSNYGNFQQAFGANHTIAGLVSSQCGVPYAAPGGSGNIQSHGSGNYFMPHAQCLGDITRKLGYQNIFMQGGKLNFTQKGAFFSAHGYDEVKGHDELWPTAPNDKTSTWGLHDYVLFDLAFKRIEQMYNNKSDKPFMLTMLTLDTHDPFEPADMAIMCKKLGIPEYKEKLEHAIESQLHCSDALLGQFVEKLKTSFGDNLDIFLVTDHLAHAHSQGKKLRSLPNRQLIFSKLSNTTSQHDHRKHTHLDLAATILDEITGGNINSLGLGASVLSDKETLLERFGLEELNRKLQGSTAALAQRYWRFPSLQKNSIKVSADKKLLWLGDDAFSFPLAFNLDINQQIIAYFPKPVLKHLRDSNMSERIIHIDQCGLLAEYQTNTFPKDDYCLIAGMLGSESLYLDHIGTGKTYQYSDFKNFMKLPSDPTLHNKRLHERQTPPFSNLKSVASSAVHPLYAVSLFTAKETSHRAVTNHRNRSIFDTYEGWKNYRAASRHALYFYQIKAGAVKRLHVWTKCDDSKQKTIKQIMSRSDADSFFLMTGNSGAPCSSNNNQFEDSRFHAHVSNLNKSEPYIGYFNRKSNKYTFSIGKIGENIELRLIDDAIYNKPFH